MKKQIKKLAAIVTFSLLTSATYAHTLYVHANDAVGNKNCQIPITSLHKVSLTNQTDHAVTYEVYYLLCVNNTDCVSDHQTFTLQPNESTGNIDKYAKSLQMYRSFSSGGYFPMNAKTQVTGDGFHEENSYNNVVVYG